MLEYLQPEIVSTVLAALAAFGAVLTVVMPMFEGNKLAERTKLVATERETLRAAQKAAMENEATSRLRDKKGGSLSTQMVNTLNLTSVFQAEPTRELLRTAGLRAERHLMVFLTMRVVVPVVLAVLAFLYTTFYRHDMSFGMRMMSTIGALGFGTMVPSLYVKNAASKRQSSIKSAWSDALDLMLICIESGMTLEQSMTRVAGEIGSASVPLAEEMQLTVAELSYLPDRKKALENLAKRTALENVKSVVTAMMQSERYGTPLGASLRVMAEENRRERMMEAERKAAALPPKLTVPMIIFFLPIIFVVVLTPPIINAMDAMSHSKQQ